ncbi:C13 family peptidase [Xanthomonas populi]|uniref:Peptidase C13 n=1 Tax=Xanthomonas populi TaxID=53414 RepID=A0A2S7EE52_9XANT|nr:C13 family peptidase [Xanthomonas populi]PPU88449.1 peptidase C13 [Xanthomonas populi]
MSLHATFGPNALLRRLSLLIVVVTLMSGCHRDAGAALPSQSAASQASTSQDEVDPVDPVDQAALAQAVKALQQQRPGVTDLFVVGFAGDASDDVFRNETLYLKQLFEQRFDARGRVVTLVNNPDNLGEHPYAPLATYDNLYDTLAAVGKRIDRKEDALLLFVTTHGTEDRTLYVQVDQDEEDFISPQDLRKALDDAGIGNRIIVLSACYSGGFIPALRSPDTLILTAARADRSSFGCGNTSNATYFGQAWLIDAINQSDDPVAAFDMAKAAITAREKQEGELPSLPQQSLGKRIAPVLARWRAGLHAGPAVAYPYPPLEDAPEAEQAVDPKAHSDAESAGSPAKPKVPAASTTARAPSHVPTPSTP